MTKSLLRIATKMALILTLVATVGALVVVVVIPRAVGGAALTVLTGSMVPTIPVGSVVVVRPVDPQTLDVGDVITYAVGRRANSTHRITKVNRTMDELSFTTRGDANAVDDREPVPASAVRGELLFAVPFLGSLKDAVGLHGGGIWLLLGGLVLYGTRQLVVGAREQWGSAREAAADVHPLPTDGFTLQLMAITLSPSEFEGLAPATVAGLLHMDLIDVSDAGFTLAVAREPSQLDDLMELLAPFHPLGVVRSVPVIVPSSPTMRDAQQSDVSHVAA